ncbi:hypothetical protein PAHAL_1G047800 [Panicum hallii]|uniref:Uncharacterized protein n=1 Tax=Panicum hallii TaxID=206008 RepID=A0A2S3GLX8_9POAL|nr:hypothetical protein PAHAL_1G047800 [Panicum hallii]
MTNTAIHAYKSKITTFNKPKHPRYKSLNKPRLWRGGTPAASAAAPSRSGEEAARARRPLVGQALRGSRAGALGATGSPAAAPAQSRTGADLIKVVYVLTPALASPSPKSWLV